MEAEREKHPHYTRLKSVGVIASLGMFLVNLVGFLDTKTGSALGCGSQWPLCNGAWVPRMNNLHVLIEFGHRLLVGGFALLAVVYVIWAVATFRRSREVWILGGVGFLFIIVQAALGAMAVVFINPTPVLALHLGFGMLAMVGVVLLTVWVFQMSAYRAGRASGLTMRGHPVAGSRLAVGGLWAYTYVAIYWGSYVAFRGAGLACPTWPLCHGKLWVGMDSLAGLDVIHRLLALGLCAGIGYVVVRLIRVKDRPDLRRGVLGLPIMVLMQVASGAHLVLTRLAMGPYLLHITTLMILFVWESYLVLQTMPWDSQAMGPTSDPTTQQVPIPT